MPEVIGAALDLLDAHDLGDVLDVGAGTGALARALADLPSCRSIAMVDPSPRMLSFAPVGLTAHQATFEEFDPHGATFKTIVMRQVLHYFEDPAGALRKAVGLLAPGGRLYVGQICAPTPAAARWLESIARRLSPHRQRVWTVDQVLELALGDVRLEAARLHPFTDELPAWIRRRAIDIDEAATLAGALETATAGIRRTLHLDGTKPGGDFTVVWLHALLAA